MKLRNKLIPLGMVAITAATITPVITSCGVKTYTYSLTKDYTPINPAVQTEDLPADFENYTKNQKINAVTDLYYEQVKKNPDIFVGDLVLQQKEGLYNKIELSKEAVWGIVIRQLIEKGIIRSIEDVEVLSISTNNVVADINVSHPQLTKHTIKIDGFDRHFLSVCMQYNFIYKADIIASYKVNDVAYKQSYTVDYTFASDYKDIPLLFNSGEASQYKDELDQKSASVSKNKWFIQIETEVPQYIEEVPHFALNWNYSYDLKTNYTDSKGNTEVSTQEASNSGVIDYGHPYDNKQVSYIDELIGIDSYVKFFSYYLKDISTSQCNVSLVDFENSFDYFDEFDPSDEGAELKVLPMTTDIISLKDWENVDPDEYGVYLSDDIQFVNFLDDEDTWIPSQQLGFWKALPAGSSNMQFGLTIKPDSDSTATSLTPGATYMCTIPEDTWLGIYLASIDESIYYRFSKPYTIAFTVPESGE